MKYDVKGFKRVTLAEFAQSAFDLRGTTLLKHDEIKEVSVAAKLMIPGEVWERCKVKRAWWDLDVDKTVTRPTEVTADVAEVATVAEEVPVEDVRPDPADDPDFGMLNFDPTEAANEVGATNFIQDLTV